MLLWSTLDLTAWASNEGPWDDVLREALPDPVRPPAWLKPYLDDRGTGKHNDLPALLEAVHNERWVTGKMFPGTWMLAEESTRRRAPLTAPPS